MSTYPYTMQPVPYELSVEEQREAQLALWKAGNVISTKVWAILAAISVAAVVGIFLVDGYSTAFFWVVLVIVAAYLGIRKYGLEWYIKREMEKQPIQPLSGFKIGVQPQGIVMVQKMGNQEGRGTIDWKSFTEWRENDKFIYMFFSVKGQNGTQIIPKRMASQKFPIDTIRKHLTEVLGAAKTN